MDPDYPDSASSNRKVRAERTTGFSEQAGCHERPQCWRKQTKDMLAKYLPAFEINRIENAIFRIIFKANTCQEEN